MAKQAPAIGIDLGTTYRLVHYSSEQMCFWLH